MVVQCLGLGVTRLSVKILPSSCSEEVQGVAAAWQLVARALGEQLQAIRETMENK